MLCATRRGFCFSHHCCKYSDHAFPYVFLLAGTNVSFRCGFLLHKPISVCLFMLVFIFFFFFPRCVPLDMWCSCVDYWWTVKYVYDFLPFVWHTKQTHSNIYSRWSCAPIEFYLHDFDCIIYGLLRRQPKSNKRRKSEETSALCIYLLNSFFLLRIHLYRALRHCYEHTHTSTIHLYTSIYILY